MKAPSKIDIVERQKRVMGRRKSDKRVIFPAHGEVLENGSHLFRRKIRKWVDFPATAMNWRCSKERKDESSERRIKRVRSKEKLSL